MYQSNESAAKIRQKIGTANFRPGHGLRHRIPRQGPKDAKPCRQQCLQGFAWLLQKGSGRSSGLPIILFPLG